MLFCIIRTVLYNLILDRSVKRCKEYVMSHSTYENLVMVAASLFRQQGYSASSVSDILTAANVAKGSLYHHFPGGKQDLAVAAARHSSQCLLALMAQCFEKAHNAAGSFPDGVQNLIEEIANLFDQMDIQEHSPVSATLLNDASNEVFRREANAIFDEWKEAFISEGDRFGMTVEDVRYLGNKFLLLMEGAWVVARAAGHSGPIRDVGIIMREYQGASTHAQRLTVGVETG